MHESIIGILTFVCVACLGGAVLTAERSRRNRLMKRLDLLSGGPAEPVKSKPSRIRYLRRLGEAVSFGSTSARLQQDLARAGYHSPTAAAVFLGAKSTLLLAALALCGFLAMRFELAASYAVLTVATVMGLAFFLPNFFVASRRRERTAELRRHLPDAVDLLEICVSSGMSIDSAWNMVTEDIRQVCPILADEMSLTTLEMHLGNSRLDAMRNMSRRVNLDELNSLVVVLMQSERFGTSIAVALKTFTRSMRELRSMKAQESAERMAVRLIFPMVLFIFPAVFIVLAGPAAIKLAEMWK